MPRLRTRCKCSKRKRRNRINLYQLYSNIVQRFVKRKMGLPCHLIWHRNRVCFSRYLFRSNKKPTKTYDFSGFLAANWCIVVGLPGFEPGQTEPKPVVLPLHHSPNMRLSVKKRCKDKSKPRNIQIFRGFFSYLPLISGSFGNNQWFI